MDPDGHTRQVQRTIGTFATYQEAEEALAEYNRNPLSMEPGVTFAEVFRRWSEEKFTKVSDNTRQSYRAAFRAIPMLHDEEFRKIRRNHLQNAIDTCGKNLPTLENIRIVIGALYKYAMQNDIVQRDYSQFIDLSEYRLEALEDEQENIHKNFEAEEIAVLWANTDKEIAVDVLRLIYSGLRICEYLSMTADDIDTEGRFLTVRKAKTRSSRRRVPIAKKTLPFWEQLKIEREADPPQYSKNVYATFKRNLEYLTRDLGLPDHLPHDTRHTTASLMQKARIDLFVRKRILGHSIRDVTEGVYTHVDDKDFLAAIDMI